MTQPHDERVTMAPPRRRANTGEPVISVTNLVKSYGRIEALRGVTLDIHRGEIFGCLGQNGAGKTTMVKLLLGIIRATDGEATMLGEPAGTSSVRKRVGYLPEDRSEEHTSELQSRF